MWNMSQLARVHSSHVEHVSIQATTYIILVQLRNYNALPLQEEYIQSYCLPWTEEISTKLGTCVYIYVTNANR